VNDTDPDTAVQARPRRRRWASLAAVGVLVAGVVAWVVTAPDTVPTADHANALVPIGAGETYYEGFYALNDRDITVQQVAAITTPGVSAEPLLCVPVPGASYIGNITVDEVDEVCSSTEPLAPGTVIPGYSRDTLQPYVLLRIMKHTDATETFCGLDITCRDGWRQGSNRQGGTHQVLLTQDELGPFDDDWTELAGCPVRADN
jgi:hypothetical protein